MNNIPYIFKNKAKEEGRGLRFWFSKGWKPAFYQNMQEVKRKLSRGEKTFVFLHKK